MEIFKADVVIVGGGGAGLRAAIAVAESDPSLKIALVSKVYPMRSHTVAAEGGAAGVKKPTDSLDYHFHDTVGGGDWLCEQDVVEYFVEQAPKELTQLEHWGCPWSRTADGHVNVRAFGGMKVERTWFAADKSGFHILHTLFQTSIKYPSIKRFDEYFCVDLIEEDGRVQGVVTIQMGTGEFTLIEGKSVIMATGGAGRVFRESTLGGIVTGDGMGMAYRHGVALRDMEFVQYHPTCMPITGLLFTEACRGEGGYLVNKDGYRYLQDYGLGPLQDKPKNKYMELGPRDRLSQAFWYEQQKGRTIEHPTLGSVVHLDLRHLGEAHLRERLPLIYEMAETFMGIDPAKEPIPIRPGVHYTMGGIKTDGKCETSLPGLYAIGECSSVGIHGANRLGSNSLTELVVFGKLAGDEATKRAKSLPPGNSASLLKQAQAIEQRVTALKTKTGGTEKISVIRKEMVQTMEDGCGIYRIEETMQKTCDKLAELRERFKYVSIDDKSSVWNTDWLTAVELDYQIDVARTMAHSAINRKESRGAHQRLDGPDAAYVNRDDVNFLKHSEAYYVADGAPRIALGDVKITKSQPAARVYGAAGEKQTRKGKHPMSDTKIIEIEVLRYLPESDKEPHSEVYKVPFTDDMSVLQGAQYIKDNFDGSLTYRWSCRMAICGSCGMMINGIPKLSCETFIRDYYPNRITIEALAHFPIEKDLVVDLSGFIEKLESIQPYIIPKEPRTLEQGEYLQSPAQFNDYIQFTSCINCTLCYAACPQFGLNSDFIGPAAIALLHRYNMDSRDGATEQRMELVASEEGVFNCSANGYCSVVCPKHVDPANAVNINKTNAAKDYFLRFLSPKGGSK